MLKMVKRKMHEAVVFSRYKIIAFGKGNEPATFDWTVS
jgi:hypothetical protein